MTEKANNIEVDPFIAQVKLTSFRKTDKYEFPFQFIIMILAKRELFL